MKEEKPVTEFIFGQPLFSQLEDIKEEKILVIAKREDYERYVTLFDRYITLPVTWYLFPGKKEMTEELFDLLFFVKEENTSFTLIIGIGEKEPLILASFLGDLKTPQGALWLIPSEISALSVSFLLNKKIVTENQEPFLTVNISPEKVIYLEASNKQPLRVKENFLYLLLFSFLKEKSLFQSIFNFYEKETDLFKKSPVPYLKELKPCSFKEQKKLEEVLSTWDHLSTLFSPITAPFGRRYFGLLFFLYLSKKYANLSFEEDKFTTWLQELGYHSSLLKGVPDTINLTEIKILLLSNFQKFTMYSEDQEEFWTDLLQFIQEVTHDR